MVMIMKVKLASPRPNSKFQNCLTFSSYNSCKARLEKEKVCNVESRFYHFRGLTVLTYNADVKFVFDAHTKDMVTDMYRFG